MSEEENQVETADALNLDPNELIKNRWKIVKELGVGNFGKVYHVINIKDGREAALKAEQRNKETLLKMEVEVMAAMSNKVGAIQMYDRGVEESYIYVVMTICGPDLTKIKNKLASRFSDGTILRIAILTLSTIKTLHEVGYVHRDLKPCNMALEYRTNSCFIYLLDFGMARKFARKNGKGVWMIRYPRTQPRFRGTIRYCSVNMHKRLELGRVDDLWSWLYMMLEMRQDLPWSNVNHPDKVEMMKSELLLSHIKKEPILDVFFPVVDHLKTLTYSDRPEYKKIYEMVKAKMDAIKVKWADPLDYDGLFEMNCEKANEVAKQYNLSLNHHESLVRDDAKITKVLSSKFEENELPGGKKYLTQPKRNFVRADATLDCVSRETQEATSRGKSQKALRTSESVAMQKSTKVKTCGYTEGSIKQRTKTRTANKK